MLIPQIVGVESLDEAGLRRLLAQCDLVLSGSGASGHVLNVRSTVRLMLGDCAGGWADLMRAFELDPRGMSRQSEARVSATESVVRLPTAQDGMGASEQALIGALDRALAREPGLAAAWAWRGLMRRCIADYAAAARDLDRAWELGERTAAVLTWRGEARLQSGDDGGMSDLEAATRLPCQAWNVAWCGRAKVAFARSREAFDYFDRALAMDPSYPWFHAWRAEAKRLLRTPEGIFDDFDRALALDPAGEFRGWTLTWRGLACVQAARWEEAVRDFDAALKVVPGYPLALNGRNQALLKLGRWKEWFEDFEHAARLDEKYIQGLYSRAPADLEAVLGALDALLAQGGGPAVRRWRGFLLTLLGRGEEAAAELERAIAAEPEHPWGWAWRGQLRLQGGAPDAAAADLDRSLALAPAQPMALAHRAKARLECGRPADALADLDAAVAIEPRYAWLFVERGCLKLLLGDARGAAADLDVATNMDRKDANALADLAVARGRAGDAAGERAAIERAMARDPDRARGRLEVWARHWQAQGQALSAALEEALSGAPQAGGR